MDSPSSMTCVLKVNTQSRDWHSKLIDVLKGLQDVSYSIDAQQGLAYITGRVLEPHKILRMLRNAGKHVRLSHVHYGNQTPTRFEICLNNPSSGGGYSPRRSIDYGCYYCGRIDDYCELGYFPYGIRGDGYRFDSDYYPYCYHQQGIIGSPLSTNCNNVLNRRCCQYYDPQMELHTPLPTMFDASPNDTNNKVKESCCHIM